MMRRIFVAMILFISLIPIQPQAVETTERVLIKFKDSIHPELLKNIEVHHSFEQLSIVSATIPTSLIPKLNEYPQIEMIEKDIPVETTEQIVNWGYEKVLAPQSNSKGWTGKGIKIGIIDTGVRTDHPDLRVAGGVSLVDGVTSYTDDEGHGTHVAGIIGALNNDFGTVGIAPEADIYAIKSLNKNGNGILSDVIAGIDWAIANNLDIINLSFTAESTSSVLQAAVDNAYEQGLLIVAASGNADKTLPADTDVLYPARYESVIAVGSIDSGKNKSKFSYYGPSLEFVAPGENIYSTFIGSNYERRYGTSMAAPFVTGIAALYIQAYPELNHLQIRELMQKAAEDLGVPGKDPSYGYGLIQAPMKEVEPVIEEPIEEEPQEEPAEEPETTVQSFTDVTPEKWYADEIDYLYKKGIITGYNDGTFLPNDPVNRAEAITMIGRALGYNKEKKSTRYTDIAKTHYASGYIEDASEKEIITGYPDGSFQPRSSIIRGDVATMLQRALQYEVKGTANFSDVKPGKYFTEPIYALFTNDIIDGYPDKTFKPLNHITRAEFAAILARALDEEFR